jgi:hypothetical protein
MLRQPVVVLALALALPAVAPRAVVAPPASVTCSFSNPGFAGTCVESAARKDKQKPAAACQPILNCLNNPRCVKTYCQATTIRQGWSLKSAE